MTIRRARNLVQSYFNTDTGQNNEKFLFMKTIGLVSQMSSGIFAWTPYGLIIKQKVINVVTKYMSQIAIQCEMPSLVDTYTLEQSGRLATFGDELFRTQDGKFCLAPTSEEYISMFFKETVKSYRDLPLSLFQITTKFRNEIRPKNSVYRSRSFTMKDSYSFALSLQESQQIYDDHKKLYFEIFKHLMPLIPVDCIVADAGAMLGKSSEEFLCVLDDLEVELGHIFNLETSFSSKFKIEITDNQNKRIIPFMGCYGIGIDRLVLGVLENANKLGFLDKNLSPNYLYVIFVSKMDIEGAHYLENLSFDVIIDDRFEKSIMDRCLQGRALKSRFILVVRDQDNRMLIDENGIERAVSWLEISEIQ